MKNQRNILDEKIEAAVQYAERMNRTSPINPNRRPECIGRQIVQEFEEFYEQYQKRQKTLYN